MLISEPNDFLTFVAKQNQMKSLLLNNAKKKVLFPVQI